MQMTAALRGELERRLDELTHARKERDEAVEEQRKNDEKVNEIKKIMERQENSFKKTLETDRNKISGEIKTKMQKLRGLEIEKQELLMETSNLMKQVESTQKELTTAAATVEECRTAAREAQRQVAELVDQNSILQKTAQTAVQTQEELREHANRLEASFKEDIGRLDTLVKESKKSAAQQVLDITDRVRHAQEEAEMNKTKAQFAAENEKKAIETAETVRAQMGIQTKSHEDMQQQMARDMTTMRRELQEHRNKQKIGAESRTKMEVETMNARMEATKAENEVVKMAEWVREVELKMAQLQTEMQKTKTERNELDRDHKKLKMHSVELEEQITKKTTANEMLTKDMAKLEREGLVETRRMRLALQVAEQELGELKVMVPMLQKELMDGKHSFSKLQGSTNETVNGLLEELRRTEDSLSAERRKTQQDADNYRRQIQEISASLDKANAHIQENVTRSNASHSDKEIRMLQLEQELERIKQAVLLKEARMEELEKQHQADRTRIHEIKESLDSAERSIMDGKTNLELEQAQRKRLELRLKTMAAAEKAHELSPRGSTASLTTPRGNGSSQLDLTPSSIEHRTKMLYGDVESDRKEPEYDDVRGKYHLDAESALSAIGVDEPRGKSSPLAKKKMRQILNSGIAGDDEDFMAETAKNPRVGGKSYDHLEVSSDFTKTSDSSNPVVDRVSQALAARAAAESSKANLRQQSQQRAYERAVKPLDSEPDSSEYGGYNSTARPSSGKSKVKEVRDLVTSASASALDATSSPDIGNASVDVEDSIQRTQMFLRQRLAQRAGTWSEATSTRNVSAAVSEEAKHEADAQFAAREAQRIAELAYERHGRPDLGRSNENNENSSGNGDDDSIINLKAPNLSPTKPINSISGGYGAKSMAGSAAAAGRIVYEDDDGPGQQETKLPHIAKKRNK